MANRYICAWLACAGMAGAAWAGSAQDLGTTLTPLGGEKAGNAARTIPAWSAENVQTPGWASASAQGLLQVQGRQGARDASTHANVDKYAEHLTPGQIALLKQNKGYKMEVYPSHRYCGAPDFVAENTKKNVGTAKLGADGWSMGEATVPGMPFPFPQNGTEAMYNAKMRYHGVGIEYKNG